MSVTALTTTEVKGTAFDDSQRPDARTLINSIIAAINLTTVDAITDPGDAGAITVSATASGYAALTSAGAETRTLAIPGFAAQRMQLFCDTYVGDIVITVASAIDTVPGSTIITMGNAGDWIELVGMTVGGTLAWRVAGNSGCALT